MREKNIIIKTIELLTTIIIYYLVGKQSIFYYVLSLSLYNVFISFFKSITIKDNLENISNNKSKIKLLKLSMLTISVISFFFLLLGLILSDIASNALKLEDLFIIFLLMGLTITIEPTLNILTDYLETNKYKNPRLILNTYYIIDSFLLIIITTLSFRIFHLKNTLAISLLYLSKIISFLVILIIIYEIIKLQSKKNLQDKKTLKVNYHEEIKKVLTNCYPTSIINIVKNSYYYISIILLYLILTTRYGYAIPQIDNDITFIYFYGLTIINYLIFILEYITKKYHKVGNVFDKIYLSIRITLPLSIIFSIISPLICNVIFYDSSKSIYLLILNFLAIFISLYDITFKSIQNKKIILISLITGLIFKLILTIPLINSFYRMGYSLMYGDILSTIIAMLLSIIINHIYLTNKYQKEKNYLEKILTILYENIILCIILILVEFIIPIKQASYLKSLLLIGVYLLICYIIFKLKNQKRG